MNARAEILARVDSAANWIRIAARAIEYQLIVLDRVRHCREAVRVVKSDIDGYSSMIRCESREMDRALGIEG